MYHVAKHHTYSGQWNAEHIDAEGEIYVVTFTGPNAEQRARDYATWINAGRTNDDMIVWHPIATAPEGVRVLTKVDDRGERNVQPLTRSGRLWFGDSGVYVYYEPTHWAPLQGAHG